MKRNMPIGLTVLALAILSSCDPREEPGLCVVSPVPATGGGALDASKLGCGDIDLTKEEDAERTRCVLDITEDGQSFVLLHELPVGVSPIGALKVHVETPCKGEDQDIEVTHVDGTAILNGVVPPGGSCALSISATMANSELRCDFQWKPAAGSTQTECKPACPAP